MISSATCLACVLRSAACTDQSSACRARLSAAADRAAAEALCADWKQKLTCAMPATAHCLTHAGLLQRGRGVSTCCQVPKSLPDLTETAVSLQNGWCALSSMLLHEQR